MIVGLGNPGSRYERTRHNIGFMAIDRLAQSTSVAWTREAQGLLGRVSWARGPLLLLKPLTFMNLSGLSAALVARSYQVATREILVIHDELDLPFGSLRLKHGGGHAGHNGLRSLAQELGGTDYSRLRLGIGRPDPDSVGTIVDYVLEAFPPSAEPELDRVLGMAVEAVRAVVESGFSAAANHVNRRTKSP